MRLAKRVLAIVAILAGVCGTAKGQQGNGPPAFDVHVVDNRTPVQILEIRSDCPVSACFIDLLTVPEGKRLVVERLSLRSQIIPQGNSVVATLVTEFDGVTQQIPAGIATSTGVGINASEVFADDTKIYAQSGAEVRCVGSVPDFEDFSFLLCSITGYLEDTN